MRGHRSRAGSVAGAKSWGRGLALVAMLSLASAPALAEERRLVGPGTLEVSAERLELDLEAGTARAQGVRLTSCGGCQAPWTISARRLVLSDDGDLDMVWPVLRLGRLPVLALPWLRVRTGRRWGLLVPRLGARAGGGFEVGQGVWGPLGARASMTAHASYLTELVGAEVGLALSADRSWLRATGRAGARGSDAQVTGAAQGRRGRLSGAARLAWTLNPTQARRLAPTPAVEARQLEISAAALTHRSRLGQTWLATELLHDLRATAPRADYFPRTALGLELGPYPLGPLWFGLRQATQVRWPLSTGGESAPTTQWRTLIEPQLAAALALGPVATRLRLTTRHAAWAPSGGDEGATTRSLAVLALDLSAPLVKSLEAGRRHWLEPAIRYRLALLDTLPAAADEATIDPAAWPLSGHALWLELRSRVSTRREPRAIEATLRQGLGLPVLVGSTLAPQLEVNLALRSTLAAARLSATLDERSLTLSEAGVATRLGAPRGTGAELSWRWLRQGSTPLAGAEALSAVPTLVPWEVQLGSHALSARLWSTLARVLRLEVGVEADLGGPALLRVGGGLGYRHRCGCLGLSVAGWYRPDRRWPDVMVALDLGGISRARAAPMLIDWQATSLPGQHGEP